MPLDIKSLHEILDDAEPLSGMGIKIKEVSRDGDRAVYVAEIPARAPGKGYVTSHYHPKLDGGTEWYMVIEAGIGAVMCSGTPKIEKGKTTDVEWDPPAPISTGDFFIVPNGVVHSLVSGEHRLRFVFGCPDAHLDNNRDKIVLEKFLPPAYGKNL
jgi:hypothetical protein